MESTHHIAAQRAHSNGGALHLGLRGCGVLMLGFLLVSPAVAAPTGGKSQPTVATPAKPDAAKPDAAKPAKATSPATVTSSAEALAVAAGIGRFYASVQGVSAEFTQVVRKRGIKKGLRRTGKMWIRKGATSPDKAPDGSDVVAPGKMRWDYPAEEIFYFSDGDTLWTYERRERVAIKLPVKDSRLYQATGYLVGQGDLSADFVLSVGVSPAKDTVALEMVPKDGTAVMQKLTLIVDKASFGVVASILVDPLGDSTSLFFAELSYGPLEDKVFAWKPPAGVTIRTL